MKTTNLQKDHIVNESGYQVAMPLDLGMRIDADDTVWTLIKVMERVDYSELTGTYQRRPRKGEATSKQLFELIVLGFINGLYSTRKIETACRNDIRFMYLLRGKRVPDHSRIASFIKEHLTDGVLERLFYQMVELLREQGEIAFEQLYVDGTKIEANANRYSFVWAKSTGKYEAHVDEKLIALLERLTVEYGIVHDDAKGYRQALLERKEAARLSFVYGRGKRKPQLQRDMEELDGLLSRKARYAGYNRTFRGRNSFSKTDPDATFMRMKEDHMKNGQLKPGYNLQLGVEGEYIVGAHICSERSDELALLGLLERMEAGCGKKHREIVADAGYESEENYKKLKVREQIAYIKPQNFERAKARKYRNNSYLRDNMPYDADKDTYTCPAGNTFAHIYDTRRKGKLGFETTVSVYECFGCDGCPQKTLCTRAQGNRRLQVSKDFLALRQASLERISSDWGKTLRLNRSIQVEGAFGVLKQDYGFRRFLRRGEANVFTEILLYAIAYNVNKLHNKMRQNKFGCTVHLLNSA
ncbi:MAG: IS1182 family transposase [Candidatus Bathyarchaeota archaeon]|nr:IS1182 family transposase [Candidatus Bathyarchaeota archaeon]